MFDIGSFHFPQFGGQFAAAILVTAETKKESGRIAMLDVRANFRPNPFKFRYSYRADELTHPRTSCVMKRTSAA